MKFSGKMRLTIILKVTKNQGFSLTLEDTLFEKPQGGQTDPPSRVRVKTCVKERQCLKAIMKTLKFLVKGSSFSTCGCISGGKKC